MEKELNIVAILKDKPKGTKLYSSIFGICTFDEITCDECGFGVETYDNVPEVFYSDGKYDKNGECTIFPSKQMQDWSKFAWKKGDVLVDETTGKILFFYRFTNKDYTKFSARYELGENFRMKDDEDVIYKTKDCHIASSSVKKEACSVLYRDLPSEATFLRYVEKPQFKDGDIVFVSSNASKLICIFKTINYGDYNYIKCYIELNAKSNYLYDGYTSYDLSVYKIRSATDSEKQQLFDALAKEGKRWNSETKTLEDLPKKCELKPFDKVLVRDKENDEWRISLFSHYTNGICPYFCLNATYKYCILYNDQTAHLLGTTDDWKGGEK